MKLDVQARAATGNAAGTSGGGGGPPQPAPVTPTPIRPTAIAMSTAALGWRDGSGFAKPWATSSVTAVTAPR